jgi:hypothetical protein
MPKAQDNDPVKKEIFVQFFDRATTLVMVAYFHYTIPPAICQEKSCTKIKKFGRPNLCILPC